MNCRSLLIRLVIPDEYGVDKYWKIRKKYETTSGIVRKLYEIKWRKLMIRFHASIPLKVEMARNVVFPHGIGGVFISEGAKIGERCVIFQQVTIGSNTLRQSKHRGAPIIGNDCYIGAGAKVIGKLCVGNNVRIGANCAVVMNIPSNCTVVMQKPLIISHDYSLDNQFEYWSKDAF